MTVENGMKKSRGRTFDATLRLPLFGRICISIIENNFKYFLGLDPWYIVRNDSFLVADVKKVSKKINILIFGGFIKNQFCQE